jgi:competence protein ComEA
LKLPGKNYFNLTKSEWNGAVVLIIVIGLVLAAPAVHQHYRQVTKPDFTAFNQAVVQLQKAGVARANSASGNGAGNIKTVLFKFNPNGLPVAQWLKLGLTSRQIRGIKNYEAKGGRFYTKADVQKMYTLTIADYHRLQPYIDLPNTATNHTQLPARIVELNTADSATLSRLKGVGPGLARRIIQYRARLGGYHSKQQLKEIFGLDDMRYQDIQAQFRVNPHKIKRLYINQVEVEDLKNFPYLNYKQANAIVQYRKQHGNYETLHELLNIAILNDALLQKIKPYLAIN